MLGIVSDSLGKFESLPANAVAMQNPRDKI